MIGYRSEKKFMGLQKRCTDCYGKRFPSLCRQHRLTKRTRLDLASEGLGRRVENRARKETRVGTLSETDRGKNLRDTFAFYFRIREMVDKKQNKT